MSAYGEMRKQLTEGWGQDVALPKAVEVLNSLLDRSEGGLVKLEAAITDMLEEPGAAGAKQIQDMRIRANRIKAQVRELAQELQRLYPEATAGLEI